MTYDGEEVNTKKDVEYIKYVKSSTVPVCVTFNSDYETIIPIDDCIPVEAASLKELLGQYSLLRHKSVCIHRMILSVISILVGTTSVYTAVSQLSAVCLPHLTTLFIIADNDSIPEPSAFSPLFEYNCFPCLKQISILRLREAASRRIEEVITETNKLDNAVDSQVGVQKVKEEELCVSSIRNESQTHSDEELYGPNEIDLSITSSSLGITIVLVTYLDNNRVENLQIGQLEFAVDCENNNAMCTEEYSASISYRFTCKSDNRLANLPGGPYKFMYKKVLYPFSIPSCKLDDFNNSIIEVAL